MKKVTHLLLATNNPAKVTRYRKLLGALGIEGLTPNDLGLKSIDVIEGSDLLENAKQKAFVYRTYTDLPILGNDTGFFMQGETMDPAQVRRNALAGKEESLMTREEIAEEIIGFYQRIVAQHNEPVPSYWKDSFALSFSDGTFRTETSIRPVLFTGEVHGKIDLHFPMRSLYIVVPTGKYVADQTKEDEALELQPISDAFGCLFL